MKTILFVDDEPKVLQGLQRQLHPMRQEWKMHFVESGIQALGFMGSQPVDIIVSDMMMPGMDGAQLLTEVLKRHPQTVRIILSGHAEREAVLHLVGPAHQYLSKPCNADELRQAIVRAFGLRDLLGNERLKRLTARIKHLPTLPTLQHQLTEELRNDSPSMERVGQIIARDLGMTTKILQLVNSAFFGLAQPIHHPAEAAVYLGLNTIRALVLTLEIFSRYEQKRCRSFSLEVLTQHSWVSGTLARTVAQLETRDFKIIDQCFLAGLLHDVGQLILAFGLPDEYAEVITVAQDRRVPVWHVEQEHFGASHADVGAYLLALWGLPNPIIEAVAQHHQLARGIATGFSPVVAVHAADVFAHQFSKTDAEITPAQLDLVHLTQLGLANRIEAWQTRCEEIMDNSNRDNL